MTEQAAQIQADALAAIDGARNEAALEEARVKFLGKNPPLTPSPLKCATYPTKTNQNSGLL